VLLPDDGLCWDGWDGRSDAIVYMPLAATAGVFCWPSPPSYLRTCRSSHYWMGGTGIIQTILWMGPRALRVTLTDVAATVPSAPGGKHGKARTSTLRRFAAFICRAVFARCVAFCHFLAWWFGLQPCFSDILNILFAPVPHAAFFTGGRW
jgi:hypothetical protein